MDELVLGIEALREEIADLRVSLDVAEEQSLHFKAKAARVPKLEAEIKKLKTQVSQLRAERERVSKALV